MSERSGVQNPILRYADSIGWTYIPSDEAIKLCNGDTGLYFTEILTAQLLKLNPGVVTPDRTADIRRRLNLLESTIEGNRDALTRHSSNTTASSATSTPPVPTSIKKSPLRRRN